MSHTVTALPIYPAKGYAVTMPVKDAALAHQVSLTGGRFRLCPGLSAGRQPGAAQCSFTRGSVLRVSQREAEPSAVFHQPCSATWCIL